MRALIRGNEIMTEPFTPWVEANLSWLTGRETDDEGKPVRGDGWTLVEDWAPDFSYEPETLDPEPTVTIDGRTYTQSELRSLIDRS